MIRFGENNAKIQIPPDILEISDTGGNCLNIKIALYKENKSVEHTSPCYEIDEKQIYKIIFDNYIMYQVRKETYCSWDDYEIRSGKYFIVFERSRLLDYVPFVIDTSLNEQHNLKHFGIYSDDYILDVISSNEPKIYHLE